MRYTRRRHRMTWPMHDAGSTTPDPRRGPPRRGQPGREQPGREDAWPDEPWRDDTDADEPDGPRMPGRGRHAAPDPLPPIEGPMLGGGPTPAETTLPLALSWPAPPARPPRGPPSPPPGA